MNTNEILSFCSNIKHFRGVFAADLIPKRLKINQTCIINCCNHDFVGEHWLAILKRTENKIEFFDSFGKAPSFYNLENKLPSCKIVLYNNLQIQNIYSSMCGLYCIHFVFFISKSGSLKHYLKNNYTNSTYLNEIKLHHFFTNYVKKTKKQKKVKK